MAGRGTVPITDDAPFEPAPVGGREEGRQDRVEESDMAATTHIGSTSFSKPADNTLIAKRTFAAPRERVWAAHTQCEHVKQWLLGPDGWTMPTCEIDLRPGGKWRYVFQGPKGATGFSFSGEYQEVEASHRLVNTETMDDAPVHTLNTLVLTEEEDYTTLQVIVEYPSSEVREQIIATGMMDGWAESYDRLDSYLASMK